MPKTSNPEFEFRTECILPATVDSVFAFFSDPRNLDRITPSSLRFCILTPDSELVMTEGLMIDYSLRIRAIPVRWRSRITEYNPPSRFVDEQVFGPYKRWHHVHEFEACEDGTIVRDIVSYAPPGGPLAPLLNRLFVSRDIRKIFAHRSRILGDIFAPTNSEVLA